MTNHRWRNGNPVPMRKRRILPVFVAVLSTFFVAVPGAEAVAGDMIVKVPGVRDQGAISTILVQGRLDHLHDQTTVERVHGGSGTAAGRRDPHRRRGQLPGTRGCLRRGPGGDHRQRCACRHRCQRHKSRRDRHRGRVQGPEHRESDAGAASFPRVDRAPGCRRENRGRQAARADDRSAQPGPGLRAGGPATRGCVRWRRPEPRVQQQRRVHGGIHGESKWSERCSYRPSL